MLVTGYCYQACLVTVLVLGLGHSCMCPPRHISYSSPSNPGLLLLGFKCLLKPSKEYPGYRLRILLRCIAPSSVTVLTHLIAPVASAQELYCLQHMLGDCYSLLSMLGDSMCWCLLCNWHRGYQHIEKKRLGTVSSFLFRYSKR